jgi:hypothetical protein
MSDKKIVITGDQINDPENTLTNFVFPVLGDDGEQVGMDVMQRAGDLLDATVEFTAIVGSFVNGMDPSEVLLSYGILDRMSSIPTSLLAEVKERAKVVAAEAGGAVDTEDGVIKLTEVAVTETKAYTQQTVELLEAKGLLVDACAIEATLKSGIAADSISDEDMAVLEKYFDVEMYPDPDKVTALTALGKIGAEEVEQTVETSQSRKGHSRISVKPSDTVYDYLDNSAE